MKQIEKHPAPEKLLQQITEEAINALAPVSYTHLTLPTT